MRNPKKIHVKLTYAGVDDAPPDGPLEEAGAAVAAGDAVVLPEGLVSTHQAGDRHWQRPAWGKRRVFQII